MPVQFGGSVRFIVALFLAFLSLSAADLGLTWLLIEGKGASAIESNPVAASMLEQHGWIGLTAFKLVLVTVIGGLSLGILWQRWRTAELLLVFGCGAQAAVVLTSVFLYGNSEASSAIEPALTAETAPEPPGLSGNATLLLLQKSVQAELELLEPQIEQVRQLASRRREIRLGTRVWTLDQLRDRLILLENQERIVLSELTTPQTKRLQQLTWQFQGPLALLDPDLMNILQLNPDQQRAIQTVLGDTNIGAPPPVSTRGTVTDRSANEELVRTQSQLWGLLDANQKAKWQEMLGEPFRFRGHNYSVVLAE